jgi:hypothetical protein
MSVVARGSTNALNAQPPAQGILNSPSIELVEKLSQYLA